jgi:hypothetical protein
MVFYEIHDEYGPLESAPHFSTVEAAITLALEYASDGRQCVRVDRIETVWEATPDV